jgi:hypothetical protein
MRANDKALLGTIVHGTVTAFCELMQRVTVAAQCGPIPWNVGGPGAFFVPLS